MNRCSPVEMRKNLAVVAEFKKYGIDFVVIPVRDKDHKEELIEQCKNLLEGLEKDA